MGKSPFKPRKSVSPSLKNFDSYYVNYEVKKVVKKTGDGDDDYVLVDKIIEHKTDIKKLIESQRSEVGVDNIIKKVLLTGDASIIPSVSEGENVDLVGVPTDIIELNDYMKKNAEKFSKLPKELTGGQSYASFMENITQEIFDKFLDSIKPKPSEEIIKEDPKHE